MDSIFSYNNYRKFLADYYRDRKEKTRFFSFRYFSKKAGFQSPGWLKFIISGERNLAEGSIDKFSKALNLKENEHRYFTALVHFNQAKTEDIKNKYFQELIKLTPGPEFKYIDKSQYEYLSKWHHCAIRAMVELDEFTENPQWIAQCLNPQIKASAAAKSLKLLKRLGLVEYNNKGRLVIKDPVLSTGDEVQFLAARNFHKQMIALGLECLDRVPLPAREVSSLTLCISEKCFSDIKERILACEKEIMEMTAKDAEKPDRVYQLNFQLFPLANTERSTGI
jgi:uncharacterized protein (TIGR02147 family)